MTQNILSTQLEQIRKHIIADRHEEARTQLRQLQVLYPDSLPVQALLMKSLAAEPFPSRKQTDEMEALFEIVNDDTEQLLELCRLLAEEEVPEIVHTLLEPRWREMLGDAANDALATRMTTLLADALRGKGYLSMAIDVYEEAEESLPLPEFRTSISELRNELRQTEESPDAEVHAVRNQMVRRLFEDYGIEFFLERANVEHFFSVFFATWNAHLNTNPVRYAALEGEDRFDFLESFYDSMLTTMDEQHEAEREADLSDESLGIAQEYISKSVRALGEAQFDSVDFVRPFAMLLPSVMMHIHIGPEVLDAFLDGDTSEGVQEGITDSAEVLAQLVMMRLASDEDDYQIALSQLLSMLGMYLPEEILFDNLWALCRECDTYLGFTGMKPLRFVPAKKTSSAPSRKGRAGASTAVKKTTKKKKER